MQNIKLVFILISFPLISSDSSLKVLSKVFWLRFDPEKRSAVNGCGSEQPEDGAVYPKSFFLDSLPNATSDRLALKSKLIELFKSYQMVPFDFVNAVVVENNSYTAALGSIRPWTLSFRPQTVPIFGVISSLTNTHSLLRTSQTLLKLNLKSECLFVDAQHPVNIPTIFVYFQITWSRDHQGRSEPWWMIARVRTSFSFFFFATPLPDKRPPIGSDGSASAAILSGC